MTFLHKEKEWFEKGHKAIVAKNYDEAIACYKKAIEINPDNELAHFGLGFAYGKKGMYDKAVTEFKKTIKINPNNGYAHNKLGIASAKKGMRKYLNKKSHWN
jgi:tetratricopeptide (TPR) repeat protein